MSSDLDTTRLTTHTSIMMWVLPLFSYWLKVGIRINRPGREKNDTTSQLKPLSYLVPPHEQPVLKSGAK